MFSLYQIPTDAVETDFMEFLSNVKDLSCAKKAEKKRHNHSETMRRHTDARGNECCHFTEEVRFRMALTTFAKEDIKLGLLKITFLAFKDIVLVALPTLV